MKTKYPILALILIVGILAYLYNHERSKSINSDTRSSLDAAYADSVTTVYNKDRQVWESSKLGFVASRKQLVAFFSDKLEEKDKRFKDLLNDKKVVDVTEVVPIVQIDTIVPTVVKDSVYYATITDKWMEAYIIARPDSTSLKQRISLPLTITKGTDGRITVATPVPYVDIVDLRGFTKVDPVRKKNWKYIIGGILGGALVYGVVR